jgi:hypothetical protein
MASRWGRISVWHILPGSTGTKNPQDAVQNISIVNAWASFTILPWFFVRDQWFKDYPLRFG